MAGQWEMLNTLKSVLGTGYLRTAAKAFAKGDALTARRTMHSWWRGAGGKGTWGMDRVQTMWGRRAVAGYVGYQGYKRVRDNPRAGLIAGAAAGLYFHKGIRNFNRIASPWPGGTGRRGPLIGPRLSNGKFQGSSMPEPPLVGGFGSRNTRRRARIASASRGGAGFYAAFDPYGA